MEASILAKLTQHMSSMAIGGGVAIYFLFADHLWLDKYLPINGKPMVVFVIVAIVCIYELLQVGQRNIHKSLAKTNEDIASISVQLDVNRLKQDVNSIYFRIQNDNETEITNENTIKEINELKDIRIRLGVNSYTQSRLEHLGSLIKM